MGQKIPDVRDTSFQRKRLKLRAPKIYRRIDTLEGLSRKEHSSSSSSFLLSPHFFFFYPRSRRGSRNLTRGGGGGGTLKKEKRKGKREWGKMEKKRKKSARAHFRRGAQRDYLRPVIAFCLVEQRGESSADAHLIRNRGIVCA